MLPEPQTIPTPVPKKDAAAVRLIRRPLRRAMLRALGTALALSERRTNAHARPDGAAVGTGQPPELPLQVGPAQDRSEVQPRILLIRPDHLGDVLFVTPALKYLREQVPGAHITLLVGPWARTALERDPHVDAIQTLEFPGFTRRAKGSPFAPYRQVREAARQLRAQQFDAAVILRFDHWWGALLAALARIPRRVGYDVPEVAPFLTAAVPYEAGRHEVAQNIRLLARAAGKGEPERVTPESHPLEFQICAADAEAARELLAAHGIREMERFAVLAPGSGAPVKLWRAGAFARVVDALADRYGLKSVLIGTGEDERALIAEIAAQAQRQPANAWGQTSLGQLAALFSRAALAIGADSGPMHLAVTMGTPSVHLFGPVSARAFGPWGDPARHVVLTSGLACIPCNRLDYGPAELTAHPCVALISERQVLAAVDKVTA